MTDLCCFSCSTVIGKFRDSGAPFNHIFYCESCGEYEELQDLEEQED
ncbi:hypothetical protein [Photobacterium leiognathi]|nr:hypothetical protein [Photobacterium leiognathi]